MYCVRRLVTIKGSRETKEINMGLFRRKKTDADEPERCPRCRERLPDAVDQCAMCGLDLRPLQVAGGGAGKAS